MWYDGGGIYRHTHLISIVPVHVSPCGVQMVAKVDYPGDGVLADARLQITTSLTNDADTVNDATVLNEVINAEGKAVATEQNNSSSFGQRQFRLSTVGRVTQGQPGRSCEHPYLYQLRTSVLIQGQTVDQVTTDFGVRTIRFDADRGFYFKWQTGQDQRNLQSLGFRWCGRCVAGS